MKNKVLLAFLFVLLPLLGFATEKYVITNLVSDEPGVALIQDPDLVNAWGIGLNPAGGAFWVSDNETGVSTLYTGDVNGSPFLKASLIVTIPGGVPTGQVFNGTGDFLITDGTATGSALFIFVSEGGIVSGWSPIVPPITEAHTALTVNGANFKGVALGANASGNFLYLADFHGHEIIVLDKNFTPVQLAGSFSDAQIPAEYSPFNIQNLGGKLYVMYALADAAGDEEVPGPGLGFVSVFDTDGNLLQHLISHGRLNAPWGIALAPEDFGPFSNALLVGNFGDGRIHAYDPDTGDFLGRIKVHPGVSAKIDGLWALTFGNGITAGDTNKLYFTAGPDDEQHGLFGSIAFQ